VCLSWEVAIVAVQQDMTICALYTPIPWHLSTGDGRMAGADGTQQGAGGHHPVPSADLLAAARAAAAGVSLGAIRLIY
jgi:hypothetical protein